MTTQTELRPGVGSSSGEREPQPVRLTRAVDTIPARHDDSRLAMVVTAAGEVRGDAGRALTLARQLGDTVPMIGGGETVALGETLASLGAIDLTAARVAEAYLDALAILQQAGVRPGELFPTADPAPVWGVFAAETSGMRLNAVPQTAARWQLDGMKPWCSLAGSLSLALVDATAAIDSGAASGVDGTRLAARVRGLVARCTEEVLVRVGHALGPSPLAFDARHARRVADLELYVRQHHAERDDAALARMLLDARTQIGAAADAGAPW